MNNSAILRLLAHQHGVVTSSQLRAHGVAPRSISYFAQRGVIEPLVPGVWRAVSHPCTFETRAMAVQLHAAPDGVLSGPTAGRMHGMRQMPSQKIYVVTPHRSKASLPSWVVRTVWSWLDVAAATVQLGVFRVLSPVCTLLTLAGLFNDHRFERAAEDAWHLKLVTPEQAASFLDAIRGSGRLGVSRFDRWLQRTEARSRPSQSGFELDVLDALSAAGLPEPQRQYRLTLATGEVVHLDIAWPDAMLAVEPGHSWWHGGDLKMAADYDRDGACGEVGWHVARLSEAARRDLAGAATRIRNTYDRRLQPQTGS
jgi:Transcriptional regulator, AbiEi antitoxin